MSLHIGIGSSSSSASQTSDDQLAVDRTIRSQGYFSIVATAGDLNSALSAVDLRKMQERAEVMLLGGSCCSRVSATWAAT